MKSIFVILIQFLMIFSSINHTWSEDSLQTVSRVFYVMGTNLEFKLLCRNREHCLNAINDAIVEVNRIDKIFSNYRSDSELSKLPIKSGKSVKVSDEFFKLTGFSVFISTLTQGAFDISVGPIIDLWKKKSKTYEVPLKNLIYQIRTKCMGFDKIKLDSNHNKISFDSECIRLDYGAVGKGYALQSIVEVLKSKKIENGLINFGGNIYALGNDLGNKPWIINIKDPDDNRKYIKRISLNNLSVSTSGGYERYFLVNNKKYSHIIDPRTGFPVSHFSSVTVVSESPLFADALSTAFSVLSIDESKKIIYQLDKIGVLLFKKSANEVNVYENDNFKKLSVH